MNKQSFTLDDFRNTPAARLNPELFQQKHAPKLPQVCQKEPKALQVILEMLQNLGIAYELEYRFHEYRKFRFDVAIVDRKIAIEYEGIMSVKSRHTNIEGYSRDADKYNLAQIMGWKVLRYTVLNYQQFEEDIKSILNR